MQHRHFRAWTVLPALGALSCLVLFTQLSGEVWLRSAIIIAVGAVIYAVDAGTRRGRSRAH